MNESVSAFLKRLNESKKEKRKKTPPKAWEVVLKDRFLSSEKPDNPYVVAVLYFLVFFMSSLLRFMSFFQLCQVKGNSMNSYLQNNSHVLLFRTVNSINHDDIVVIKFSKDSNSITNPTDTSYNIIKRVVGLGGDTLKFVREENNIVRLYRKKKGENEFQEIINRYCDEPMYYKSTFTVAFGSDIVIPDEQIFVVGYNWNNSEDSRMKGAYPVKYVIGKMFVRVERNTWLESFLKFLYHADKTPAND